MPDQLIERASLLLQQKRYDEAQKILTEVLAIQPDNVHTLVMLADIKIHNNDLPKALELINSGIAIDPEYDLLFYYKAKISLLQEKLDEAIENITQAISIDPYDADNYAYYGHILIFKKQFTQALENANEALELDPSNLLALNVRSKAQLKLNLKEESFNTISEALREDPNNSYTHANYAWGLLEKGDKDKALEHFSESLKNDPNSEYAQAGMAEALKAKYIIYRWFLKYSFWMNNMTSKNQWIFIVGFYFGQKVLSSIANRNETLKPYLTPIIILLAVFAFSTWIITPLSNLLFRLNKYGQHLLSVEEKKSSTLVGISLLTFFLGAILYLFTKNDVSLSLMFIGFSLMLPLGRFYDTPTNFYKTYNIALIICAILSVTFTILNGDLFNIFTVLYFIGFMAFQWAANYFSMKRI